MTRGGFETGVEVTVGFGTTRGVGVIEVIGV